MRKNNFIARRNVRNSKQALAESIMAKVAPIVKKALNEDVEDDEDDEDDEYAFNHQSIEVPTTADFIYYNNVGGEISFETQSSLKRILRAHDYSENVIAKALLLDVFKTMVLKDHGEITGLLMRMDDINV